MLGVLNCAGQRSRARGLSILLVAVLACLVSGCSSHRTMEAPYSVAGPIAQIEPQAQPPAASHRHEDVAPGDPFAEATPEPRSVGAIPDDPKEPWSPNYGGPNPGFRAPQVVPANSPVRAASAAPVPKA